jgi:Rieske Fe-S protein
LHMSSEDQPVDRTPGDYQDEAGMLPSPAEGYPDAMGGVDPFALWAATSGKPLTSPPTPETSTRRPPLRGAKSNPRSRPRPAQRDRRGLVKLLAVGTAGIVTVVTVGGISFARTSQGTTQSPSRIDDDQSDESTSIDAHRERDDDDWGRRGRQPHKTPTPSKSPTPRPSPTQTKTPQPSPTSQPTKTPTPTTPAGTVIGSTSQATNSAVSFTNPADSQGSLLIHLSNGNWVACERSCTHQGAWVNYDSTTGQLVCPAHGAIFDPLTGCSHVSGPGSGPLASVGITVNANGTITTP